MRVNWGMVAVFWLGVILCLPGKGTAAESGFLRSRDWRSPILLTAASSPLDAQMLGEKPAPSSSDKPTLLNNAPGMRITDPGSATLNLHRDLKLRVSFLYKGEEPSPDLRRPGNSLPLFQYSMDYRLFPNLQVGLSGYLYHSSPDQSLALGRPYGERVMGLGPGVRYDLGRWSLVFKSQLETGSGRDRGDDLQNWLRVWYAF